nr:DUF2147 domain-containing protein [uncultured Rhodopila sp.]
MAILAWAPCSLAGAAAAEPPVGTWLLADRLAIDVSECNYLYCGRIVWVRPGTPGSCGETIVWGLTPDRPGRWNDGWFFDPETGQTFTLSASLQPDGSMSARLLNLVQLYGKVEPLKRIEPRSLSGWCRPSAAAD